jgi:TATA-box binding protein (TBP) (component of TFIID and TFIIIB)
MHFDADFESSFDRFMLSHKRLETLASFVNVSTMSFVSHITSPIQNLFDRTTALRGTSLRSGEIPIITKSTFTTNTLDVIPFPCNRPSLHIRAFCTKGKLLVTGCKSIIECVAALDDICSALDAEFTFPECRLINANCALPRRVSLSGVMGSLGENPWVTFIDKPERQHRVLVTFSNATKGLVYASGKFSVHGKCLDSIYMTIKSIEPVLRLSHEM